MVNNQYAVVTRVWIKFKGYHKLYWVTLQIMCNYGTGQDNHTKRSTAVSSSYH